MDDNKKREGVSVKEIESFAKKHRFEVVFCLIFVLACFFSFVMWGPWWTIIAATAGAILGVFFPAKITGISQNILQFIFKQEQTTQLVLAIVSLILAIFIPPLAFLIMGLHGGKDLIKMAMSLSSTGK
jgi:hypothetical protein